MKDSHVTVKGKLGTLEYDLLPGVVIETEDNTLQVKELMTPKR